MSNLPLISVIVPVYGVEKYLAKCVDSILNQTYKNLELILVDDGSPDKCGEICDEYAQKDNRVKVIHKENGGQGTARNRGLDICTGSYITFLDSDDYMVESCIEKLYSHLIENDLEISACNYSRYAKNGDLISVNENRFDDFIVDGIEAQKRIWYAECINLAPWGKLYKRELWDDVRFKECRFYEDYATMHYVYTKTKRFGYLHKSLVNYLVRNNSTTRRFNEIKYEVLDIADDTISFAEKKQHDLFPAAICKAVSTYFHICMQMSDNEEYNKRISAFVKKYRKTVLKDKRATKKVRIACLLSYFGLGFVKNIFNSIK